jgi:hypothetical protein
MKLETPKWNLVSAAETKRVLLAKQLVKGLARVRFDALGDDVQQVDLVVVAHQLQSKSSI